MSSGEFLLSFDFPSSKSESFFKSMYIYGQWIYMIKLSASDPDKKTMNSGIRKHFLSLLKLLSFAEPVFSPL